MRGASSALLSNKCLTYGLDWVRVGQAAGTLQPERANLALRVVGRGMVGENGEVRRGLKNGDHGELVLPVVDASVRGRVVHVLRSAEQRGARGGA